MIVSTLTRKLRFARQSLVVTLAQFAIVACLSACQRTPKRESTPAPSNSSDLTAPRLKLEQAKVELDPVVQDEAVHRSMALLNLGLRPLEIGAIDSSRFCSGSVDPKTLAPGERGKLDITCRSDLYGPMREGLVIHSNDPKSAKTTIQLVANVTPLLAFDTQNVDLKMFFGEQRSKEVHLVGTLVDKAQVKLKDKGIADVDIEPIPAQAGQARGFRIHCLGRKVGMNVGNLFITTGLEHPKEIAIPYACKVGGTLEVSPTNPYFNLKVSGSKAVTIDVRSSQPNFELQAVNVIEGPFAASFEHAPQGASFLVKVTVLDDHIDDETRGVTGKIVIVSNDRTEPQKEMPLFGFGQVNRASPLEAEQAP